MPDTCTADSGACATCGHTSKHFDIPWIGKRGCMTLGCWCYPYARKDCGAALVPEARGSCRVCNDWHDHHGTVLLLPHHYLPRYVCERGHTAAGVTA